MQQKFYYENLPRVHQAFAAHHVTFYAVWFLSSHCRTEIRNCFDVQETSCLIYWSTIEQQKNHDFDQGVPSPLSPE